MEGTCYHCGKKGHLSPNCPEKDTRPKSEWAFKKANIHMCAEVPPRIPEEEDEVSAVSSWTSNSQRTRSSQKFISAQVIGYSSA